VTPSDRRQHDDIIRAHFDRIAPKYRDFKARNPYYHAFLERWVRAMAPPGRRVLDVGCGRGEILRVAAPSVGVGIDIAPAMIDVAKADHGGLDFRVGAIEDFAGDASFDTALAINLLEYTWDVGAVLDRIRAALRDNGRLLITTANPVWSPILSAASAMGLRVPDCRRLFITNRDLMNLLELHGFEVVDERMHLALPKRIPVLSTVVNGVVSRIPGVRLISSMQLVVARKLPETRRQYSVSIVIPCFNERENTRACLERVRPLGLRTEVIFVDDGSTDGTAASIQSEVNPAVDVRVVSYTPNRGKGHAVKTGFDAARGDIVMVLDADLTVSPADLQPLYEAFATGRAEFVNGTRFVYPMDGRAMKWSNYMGNRLFTILVSFIMGRRISDTLCGTKAMFKSDWTFMTMGRDPWGDYDLLFGAAQLRLTVRELPVHYRERTTGRSKMKALSHGLSLIRLCWLGFLQVQTMPAIRKQGAGETAEPTAK